MLICRYRDRSDANRIASHITADSEHTSAQIELVVERDARGRLHVVDPTHGIRAMAKSDVVSWGGLGLVLGAVAGAVAGGGILGFLAGGLITAIVWGLFGLAAGALYGMWAGRAVSARRLKDVSLALANGGSSLLAWADGRVDPGVLETFLAPGSQSLVIRFESNARGAAIAT